MTVLLFYYTINCSVDMNHFLVYQHFIFREFNFSWMFSKQFLPSLLLCKYCILSLKVLFNNVTSLKTNRVCMVQRCYSHGVKTKPCKMCSQAKFIIKCLIICEPYMNYYVIISPMHKLYSVRIKLWLSFTIMWIYSSISIYI